MDLLEGFFINALHWSESVLSYGRLQLRVESLHLCLITSADLILDKGENFLLKLILLALLIVFEFYRNVFKIGINHLICFHIITFLEL